MGKSGARPEQNTLNEFASEAGMAGGPLLKESATSPKKSFSPRRRSANDLTLLKPATRLAKQAGETELTCQKTSSARADFYANPFARHHDLAPAVLLSARQSRVVRRGAVFAESLGSDIGVCQALVQEIGAHFLGALLGEGLIDLIASDVIGITFDSEV